MRQMAFLVLILFFANVAGVFSFTASFAQDAASTEVDIAASKNVNQNISLFNAENSDDENESNESEDVKILENNKMYFSFRSYSFQGKVILEQDSYFQCTIMYFNSSSSYTPIVYYDIYIYQKNASEVTPIRVNSYNGRISPQFLLKGEYYIVVLPYSPSTSMAHKSFMIYVSYSATEYYETEDNSSVENANDIKPWCLIRGNLRSASDEDWYVFDIPSKKCVTITLKHNELDEGTDSNIYWHYELFDSNLNSVTSNNVGGLVSEKSSKAELEAGTYYVSVSSDIYSNTQYQIEVSIGNPSIWSYTWTWVVLGILSVIFVIGAINYIRIIIKHKA